MASLIAVCLSLMFIKTTTGCQNGFIPFKGHCYKFLTEKKTWTQAKHYCTSFGATLASIETNEENEWIKLQLLALGAVGSQTYFGYIGGTDLLKTYDWRLESTGKSLKTTFQDWGPGEPHGTAVERCMAFEFGTYKYYGKEAKNLTPKEILRIIWMPLK